MGMHLRKNMGNVSWRRGNFPLQVPLGEGGFRGIEFKRFTSPFVPLLKKGDFGVQNPTLLKGIGGFSKYLPFLPLEGEL